MTKRTYGDSGSTEYRRWYDMIRRCTDPNSVSYPWYGAKGIKVCKRWLKYENFLSDMGRVPNGNQLDRINPEGDYEPGNVRWVTVRSNVNNRINTKKLTYRGITKPLVDWADELGITRSTLYARKARGMSDSEALEYVSPKYKSHCKLGYPLTGENLRIDASRKLPFRRCRICERAAGRRYFARKQAKKRTGFKERVPHHELEKK